MMQAYLDCKGEHISSTTVHKYMNTEMGLRSIVRRKKPEELYDAIDIFAYVTYNHERPHTYDNGRTPFEARYNAA